MPLRRTRSGAGSTSMAARLSPVPPRSRTSSPASGQLLAGNSLQEYHWHVLSGFIQDDWRIKPRLMLNLGLRYEYKSPIQESRNLWANFDPAANPKTGLVQQGQP